MHPDQGIHRSKLRIQIQIREANLLQIRSEPDKTGLFVATEKKDFVKNRQYTIKKDTMLNFFLNFFES